MNSVMLALGDVAGPAQEIRVSGSFTRTELCVKILADAFDHEINAPNVDEGAAFGAAIPKFVSAEVLDDISATARFDSVKKTYTALAQPKWRSTSRSLAFTIGSIGTCSRNTRTSQRSRTDEIATRATLRLRGRESH
jgi:sugar (pentulose or hexulose) kinase